MRTFWQLLLIVCFENSFHVFAWGPYGHSLIVRLAQSQLSPATEEWVRFLTPWHWNGNLSAMASWADDILYPDANPTGYNNWRWSAPLHYINTPDWTCEYNAERDCIDDNCIAGAIKNYTRRLETELDEIQQQEALYFLIHFIGDIHQPLHVGFKNDRGGNDIKGYFMNESPSIKLHTLWDSKLLLTRLQRDFQENITLYYDYIYQMMLNQSQLNSDDNEADSLDQIIKECVDLDCSQVYLDENNATMNTSVNFTLGEIYYQRSVPIMEQQFVRGGRRLGNILNQITSRRLQNVSSHRVKLCSGTIALIVILCAEVVLVIIGAGILWFRRRTRSLAGSSPVIFSKK